MSSSERGLLERAPVAVAATILVGLLTGVLTLAGQSVLSSEANRLANSGAIWLSVAFVVGAVMPSVRTAAVAGIATLVLAVAGYYSAAALAGAGATMGGIAFWVGTAAVGGPMFGAAGHLWRRGAPIQRAAASALLGAVFVAEGAFTLIAIPDLATTGWVEVVVGLAIAPVLAGSTRERVVAAAMLVPLAGLGLLAFFVIDRVLGG